MSQRSVLVSFWTLNGISELKLVTVYMYTYMYTVTNKLETALSRDRLACLAPPDMVFFMYVNVHVGPWN